MVYQEALKLAIEICMKSPDSVSATKVLYQKTYVNCSERKALDIETKLQTELLGKYVI